MTIPQHVIKPDHHRLGKAAAFIAVHCFHILTPLYLHSAQSKFKMVNIKVGDTVPRGNFATVPYTPELEDGLACGIRTSPKSFTDTLDSSGSIEYSH